MVLAGPFVFISVTGDGDGDDEYGSISVIMMNDDASENFII